MTTSERIEENANLALWCVHVLGLDDVYAAPSHDAAVVHARELNKAVHARADGPRDVLCFAYAAPWPHSREHHASSVKRWDELVSTPTSAGGGMAELPKRITLSRAKGWKMPPNTVKVDRSTKWGNPFAVSDARAAGYKGSDRDLAAMCVGTFRSWLKRHEGPVEVQRREAVLTALPELRGKNLACWCKPGEPCHADVLLELANAEPSA